MTDVARVDLDTQQTQSNGSIAVDIDASTDIVVVVVSGWISGSGFVDMFEKLYWTGQTSELAFTNLVKEQYSGWTDETCVQALYMLSTDAKFPGTGAQTLNYEAAAYNEGFNIAVIQYSGVDTSDPIVDTQSQRLTSGVHTLTLTGTMTSCMGVIAAYDYLDAVDANPSGSGQTVVWESGIYHLCSLGVGEEVAEDELQIGAANESCVSIAFGLKASDPGAVPEEPDGWILSSRGLMQIWDMELDNWSGTMTSLILTGNLSCADLTADSLTTDDITLSTSLIFGSTHKLTSTGLSLGASDDPVYTLELHSSTSGEPRLQLVNTNADDNSSELAFVKNSPSPADDDELGTIRFYGNHSQGAQHPFALITGISRDITYNSEGGGIDFDIYMNGAPKSLLKLYGYNGLGVGQGEIVFNEAGQDVDTRIEASGVANALKVDGSNGLVTLGAIYANDMNGDTLRSLKINSNGELGYDSAAEDTAPINLLDSSGHIGAMRYSLLAQGTTGRQTDYEIGTAEHDDDAADDDTTDYTVTGAALSFDTDHYVLTEDGGSGGEQTVVLALTGLTVDRLYKFSLDIQDGTDAWDTTMFIQARNNANDKTLEQTALASSSGSYADHSVLWRATETNNKIRIYCTMPDTGGDTLLLKNIHVHEVKVGGIGKAVNGWSIGADLSQFVRVAEDVGLNGHKSLYAIEIVNAGASASNTYGVSSWSSYEPWLAKLRGRTLTFSATVKASAANKVRLQLGGQVSSYNAGSTAERLSVTATIASDASTARPIVTVAAGATIFLTSPMLCYGENTEYCPPSDKWTDFPVPSTDLKDFSNDAFSDVSSGATICLVGQSDGKIPTNIQEIKLLIEIKDSGASSAEAKLELSGGLSSFSNPDVVVGCPAADDRSAYANVVMRVDQRGFLYYKCDATGANTLDITITPIAVKYL